MSSEVEIARRESFVAASRASSRHVGQAVPSLGMTEKLFSTLAVFHDATPRLAAMNMAIDEALLENANIPFIRFYQWDHLALSFGYFGRFADVAQQKRDLVRRWTGGGIVFHGEDLTYAIVIPSSDSAFWKSSISIYEKVHRALCNALVGIGIRPEMVGSVRRADRTPQRGIPACFAHPVCADVMLNGRKIAGAAQRRTRRGLLHQGSIQNIEFVAGFAERFARALAEKIDNREIDDAVVQRAEEIARRKYGTEAWLQKH